MYRREFLGSALSMVVGLPQAAAQPYLGLVELTRLLHKKELSPVEVLEAQLARIAALDPTLHSYARLTADLAREQARAAEKRILAGKVKGPLDGAPVGVKDIIWTRDAVTAAGSALYANFLPPENATCVERLFHAGAVLLGKLTTTEFAGAAYDVGFPVPLNPWNRSLWPGASSSGPGVALAAGLCYGALGTDTGGSIRFPAAMDGIVGFKPTWGRISTHGIFYGVPSMDHVGPMARTVEDVSALFQSLSGPDSRDPRVSDRPLQAYELPRKNDLRGLKIGLDADFGLNDTDPTMRAVMDTTVTTLKGLGASLLAVRFPDRAGLFENLLTIAAQESIDYKNPATAAASRPDPGQYRKATAWRASFSREVATLLSRIDVLLTPAVPAATMPAAGMEKLELDQDLFQKTLRYVAPFDLTGSPVLVLPAGFNEAGGPIGIQLVAQRFREDVLLQTGYAFEQVTQWHLRRPRLQAMSGSAS